MPLLETRKLCKAYSQPVLIDFDFELESGEVHALMGSNGAGKSTLARILCGLTKFDHGEVRLDGQAFFPDGRKSAADKGVVMVMQELNLIPTLSVAENLFFTRLPHKSGFIATGRLHEQTREALARVNLQSIDPDRSTASLGIGQQQLLEIAIALTQKCRVLILDEPTAALTDPEIEILFQQIRILKGQGVGIIYISHRMDEIRRIADRVTTLRDGRRIQTHSARTVSISEIIREMSGHDLRQNIAYRRLLDQAPTVLEVDQLTAPPLRDISLKLRQGEILGVAGLVGSGRTELLRAIYGADKISSGMVYLRGKPMRFRHPADAVAAGIGMVPEDRKDEGLLLQQSIRNNASLANLMRYSRFGRIDHKQEITATASGCNRLSVKHHHLEQIAAELSGGNQQKVVLLRWILRDCNILLLDEPTRGIDIAAKEAIYSLLRELADNGKSLIIVSSELEELTLLCDRIAVLSGGRITDEFTPDTWSHQALTQAAFKAHLTFA